MPQPVVDRLKNQTEPERKGKNKTGKCDKKIKINKKRLPNYINDVVICVNTMFSIFQYDTTKSALDINQYRYQFDVSTLQMMHIFMTYFVGWRVSKAVSGNVSQTMIVSNSSVTTCVGCVGV